VTALASLALATLAFVGSHFLMSHPLRVRLVQALGERGFALAYSLVALVTFAWMVLAYGAVNSSAPLWVAPDWWWTVASLIMLLASILLVGSFVGNPAFPHPGAAERAAKPAAGVFAITRHPMNWSFMLWALVHISLWGSLRNLIVAAGILVLALFGSIGQDARKRALLGKSWTGWEARTSFVPFGALLAGRAAWRAAAPGWIILAGGFALWLAVTSYHAPQASFPGWLGLG
jgi:uncharacterized membrane protein